MCQHDTNNVSVQRAEGISPFIASCLTLNYIIGVGILAIPWAFHRTGPFLASIAMVMICTIAVITGNFLLATMARADSLISFENLVRKESEKTLLLSPGKRKTNVNEKEKILDEECLVGCNEDLRLLSVGKYKFDISELCHIFLGDIGFFIYEFVILFDIYGALWAYASVFATTMDKAIPLGEESYSLWCIIFAFMVIPLSFLKFSEQAFLQVMLTGCRILVIFLLVVTPLLAAFGENSHQTSCFGNQEKPLGVPLLQFSGFSDMMPIIIFSTVFQQMIPSVSEEVGDKTQLSSIFAQTFTFCGASYILIGVVGAWYFGDMVEQDVNLNWLEYHCLGSWLSSFIKVLVLCFPAIDVISLYPLDAICLTSSLIGLTKRGNHERIKENFSTKCICTAIASIPPIIGALYIRNLGEILSYACLSGLAIAFCFPSILYISSEIKMKRLGIPHKTIYDKFGSSTISACAVFIFGFVTILILSYTAEYS